LLDLAAGALGFVVAPEPDVAAFGAGALEIGAGIAFAGAAVLTGTAAGAVVGVVGVAGIGEETNRFSSGLLKNESTFGT
jgi:hypothetical protein